MNYEEALAYLYNHLPMYQRIGAAAYKKDLTNTIALLDVLGNPHQLFASIHVGGTNGKGSVSNMLASICSEAGYTVGLYTSPHLVDFRERIRVNGKMCEAQFVADFVTKMLPHIEKIQPSFFEMTVAMAFDYFRWKGINIAIVEVGLGGRLDSTNVITPKLSVITNIGYDHMQMLGNTLAEIGFEKAGIIKPNVPVVIGEFHTETIAVFESAAELANATLYATFENVEITLLEQNYEEMGLDITYLNQLIYPNLKVDLTADYQLLNVATAIQALEVMRVIGIEISEEAIYDGFSKVKQNTGFAGRWQLLHEKPTIIADSAHNSDGLKQLFNQVDLIEFEQLHIVTGAVNDKDLSKSLNYFPKNAHFYFCKPDIPRGLEASALQEMAAAYGLQGESYESVASALARAIENAGKNDLILICGSIFVVAEALPAYEMLNSNTQ